MARVDDEFVRETRTHVEALNNGLIEVEENPDDQELVNDIFRTAHILKGNCSVVGLEDASNLAHAIEDVLDAVRAGRLDPVPSVIDKTLDALDDIEVTVDAVAADREPDVEAESTFESLRDEIKVHLEDPAAQQPDSTATESSAEERIDDSAYEDDLDPSVVEALESASEFDDLDELVDDVEDDGSMDDLDGWGTFGEASSSETADAGAESADLGEEWDDFTTMKSEVSEESEDLDELQEDLEEVEFGQFDEEDDTSIQELIDVEASSDAGDADAGLTPETEEPSADPVTAPAAVPADETDADEPAVDAESAPEADAEPAVEADAQPADEPTVDAEAEPAPDAEADAEPADEPTVEAEAEPAADTEADADEPTVEADADSPVEADGTAEFETLSSDAEADPDGAVEAGDLEERADAADATAATESDAEAEIDPLEPEEPSVEADAESAESAEPEPIELEDIQVEDVSDPAEASGEPADASESLPAELTDVEIPETEAPADAQEPADTLAELDDVEISGDDSYEDLIDEPVESQPSEDTGPDMDSLDDVELDEELDDGDVDLGAGFQRDEDTQAFESEFGREFDREDPEQAAKRAVTAMQAVSTVEESRLDTETYTTPAASNAAARAGSELDEIQSITVDVDIAEELLNLVGELETQHLRMEQSVEASTTDAERQTFSELDSVTTDLRGSVMDLRLMELDSVVGTLPRVVRDIARSQDKEVSFSIDGEEIKLDRSIIDRLGDPLVHLVRNAIDHGIEEPDTREAAGKPEEGTVELRARREGDRAIIEIEDDGSGIDVESVREQAVEADLLEEAVAAEMAPSEIRQLVLEPGFSTAGEVSEVSGRGVGMDVVDRAVRDLNGTIDLESDPGEGTTIRLTVPVTVAIAEVLYAESGGEWFAIPVSAVEQVEAMGETATVAGEERLLTTPEAGILDSESGTASEQRETVAEPEDGTPLIRLGEAFETAPATTGEEGVVVRIRPSARELAVHCDSLGTIQEVVLKPYEELLGDVPGLSGAAARTDGSLANVIDVASL